MRSRAGNELEENTMASFRLDFDEHLRMQGFDPARATQELGGGAAKIGQYEISQ
jgi:hypothetical protein